MDDAVAMDDEFQEADILWPDTEDELVVPFAPAGTGLPYEAAGSVSGAAAPVLGRRFEGLFLLSTGARPWLSASASACADADDDGEEWQEADVLWPEDTAGEPRGGLGSLWPFPGCTSPGSAGRHLMKPAAAARSDGWRTGPAASTPIDIPANVFAARRRF
ncbi:hypothetical protein BS78_03G275200 [Paspalum vaginatum]|nr:hypothetical protein BS78_03G275200 [Paspalum vaginatum]